ncbi:uncharacterized protein LOC102805975 [Saccoglossus kowalevskii]
MSRENSNGALFLDSDEQRQPNDFNDPTSVNGQNWFGYGVNEVNNQLQTSQPQFINPRDFIDPPPNVRNPYNQDTKPMPHPNTVNQYNHDVSQGMDNIRPPPHEQPWHQNAGAGQWEYHDPEHMSQGTWNTQEQYIPQNQQNLQANFDSSQLNITYQQNSTYRQPEVASFPSNSPPGSDRNYEQKPFEQEGGLNVQNVERQNDWQQQQMNDQVHLVPENQDSMSRNSSGMFAAFFGDDTTEDSFLNASGQSGQSLSDRQSPVSNISGSFHVSNSGETSQDQNHNQGLENQHRPPSASGLVWQQNPGEPVTEPYPEHPLQSPGSQSGVQSCTHCHKTFLNLSLVEITMNKFWMLGEMNARMVSHLIRSIQNWLLKVIRIHYRSQIILPLCKNLYC